MGDKLLVADIIAALRAECTECSEQHWCKDGINGAGIYCPIQDAAALLEQDVQPNDPLTLEELRGMDGRPVWCRDDTIDAGIVRMAEDWATERQEPHIWMFDKYGDVKCYNIRLTLKQGARLYRRPPEGSEG